MAVALARLGLEIGGSIDEQESIILRVAAGQLDREGLTAWLRDHVTPRST